jgi:enolase
VPVVKEIEGREILDSRGRPTVEATCTLENGVRASASVPSGASTGAAEAWELRDGDPKRYGGLGCRKAADHLNRDICQAITSRDFTQASFDACLIQLDGTHNKSRLGANAILAASVAFARVSAKTARIPLWQHFAEIANVSPEMLPRLTINLLSGGKHAGQPASIQDVMVVPVSPQTIDEALAMTYDVYQSAAKLIYERYGMRLLRADEGGLAPPCRTAEEMIETALDAIRHAGYKPGSEISLALDVAASHFYTGEIYELGSGRLLSNDMIERIRAWVTAYPIVSVEDGLAEDDWDHWPGLRETIQENAIIVGDDLLCTNPQRIERGIREQSCNALLLKVNQIGTLTEAAQALRLARDAGWSVTISVRSGETEDDWAADLAVGWGGDQFKNGSITQSERLSKYNRLLAIEEETHMPLTAWPPDDLTARRRRLQPS